MVGTQSLDSLGFGEAPDGPPEDALATAHNDVLAAMALREPREQKQDELFRIGGFLIAASSALADAVVRTAFQVARWRLQAAGTQTPLGLQSADVFSWWLPHKMLPWRLLARECIMQGTAEVAFYQSVATLSPSTGPTVAALMAVLYVWPLQFRSLSVAVAPEAIDALGGIGAQFHHILSHRLLLLSALGVGMACHIFKSTCVYVGFSVLRKRKPGATALYLPSLAMPVLGELFTDVATYPLVTVCIPQVSRYLRSRSLPWGCPASYSQMCGLARPERQDLGRALCWDVDIASRVCAAPGSPRRNSRFAQGSGPRDYFAATAAVGKWDTVTTTTTLVIPNLICAVETEGSQRATRALFPEVQS
eukprot:m.82523 g.82523  ORF g.82523 m.82523 type:complete len:363 (-) comp8264_c0_seq3:15-1103(-)